MYLGNVGWQSALQTAEGAQQTLTRHLLRKHLSDYRHVQSYTAKVTGCFRSYGLLSMESLISQAIIELR